MDEMKIKSPFTTGLVSDLIRRLIAKKMGCDIGIQLNDIEVTITDGKAHVRLKAECDIGKEEILNLVKKISF